MTYLTNKSEFTEITEICKMFGKFTKLKVLQKFTCDPKNNAITKVTAEQITSLGK